DFYTSSVHGTAIPTGLSSNQIRSDIMNYGAINLPAAMADVQASAWALFFNGGKSPFNPNIVITRNSLLGPLDPTNLLNVVLNDVTGYNWYGVTGSYPVVYDIPDLATNDCVSNSKSPLIVDIASDAAGARIYLSAPTEGAYFAIDG